MNTIDTTPIQLEDRARLHPILSQLTDGISEFTFANLFLFREHYDYRWGVTEGGTLVITGRDARGPFFMLPTWRPGKEETTPFFALGDSMKCASKSQADYLEKLHFPSEADRDNFDYLYSREELAHLPSRRFHKKRNLIRAFIKEERHDMLPLTPARAGDALAVLDAWRAQRDDEGDYEAARKALNLMESLDLCGIIHYVHKQPVAYVLGEGIADGEIFLVHFEKAISGFKGLYQLVNLSFAVILPERYTLINREQDLGIEALRKAKMSYKPLRFVEKFRIWKPRDSG